MYIRLQSFHGYSMSRRCTILSIIRERERERKNTLCVYVLSSFIRSSIHLEHTEQCARSRRFDSSTMAPFFSSLVINMYIRQRRKIRHSFFSFFAFELPAHALSHSVLHLVKMPVVHHRCIYIYICTSIFTSMSI